MEADISRVAVVVKGYPRLSETFITQEILGLERLGVPLQIWSLRHPTERLVHPMHEEIRAEVRYLPEYLHRGVGRVLLGLAAALARPGFGRFVRAGWRDVLRDPSFSRMRRLGQALVLARELPGDVRHLHVHYLHTPASVVRYAALLTGLPWSVSAHAKDIWTTPAWEKREKLAEAAWGVTCTADGASHLSALSPTSGHVTLLHHGLALDRFPPPTAPSRRDGTDPYDPVRIVSVGRAVEKKGFDDLLSALAALPPELHWRFAHIGGGELLDRLRRQAAELGLGERAAFLGPKAQPDVLALMAASDLFVLPSKEAAGGDRDGLPNVIMEAASQETATVATRFAGIPEFVRHGTDGLLVEPGDWEALSNAINGLCRDPAERARLGSSAHRRLRREFRAEEGFALLADRLLGRRPDARESSAA